MLRSEDDYGSAAAGWSSSSVDFDHPSNRTPTHQTLNNSRPHSRDTRGGNGGDSLSTELTPNLRRDRLNLNLLTGECLGADDEDLYDQNIQFIIKTPVSPSKAGKLDYGVYHFDT